MLSVYVTKRFEDRFEALPPVIKKKFHKQLAIFKENPLHPSLNTEKLQPKTQDLWSFRIDRSYRVIFRFINAVAVTLVAVGNHDYVYRINP